MGRKKAYHKPKRLTILVEQSDFEAGEAMQVPHSAIYRMGIKQCALTRPEVLSRLAAAEDHRAEEHEAEAEMHRHRAQELRGKTRNGQITGPEPADSGVRV